MNIECIRGLPVTGDTPSDLVSKNLHYDLNRNRFLPHISLNLLLLTTGLLDLVGRFFWLGPLSRRLQGWKLFSVSAGLISFKLNRGGSKFCSKTSG